MTDQNTGAAAAAPSPIAPAAPAAKKPTKKAAAAKKTAKPAKAAKAAEKEVVTLADLLAGTAKGGIEAALARKNLNAGQLKAVSILRVRLNEAHNRARDAAK